MRVEDFIKAKQEAMKLEHLHDLAYLRSAYKNLLSQVRVQEKDDKVRASDFVIELTSHSIQARRYLPEKESGDLIVFFHGGGFVLGDLDTHDELCQVLANRTSSEVLAIDYRLSPEHPFPAALEDAKESIIYAMKTSDKKIFLCGESAGANLAASAVLSLQGENAARVQGLILMYPFLDMTLSYLADSNLPSLFSKEELYWYSSAYCPQNDLKNHPLVSPIFAENITHFAPTLFLLAGEDPLRQEGQMFADLLEKNNYKTIVEKQEGMPHGYLLIKPLFNEQIEVAMKKIGDFLSQI